MVHFGYGTFVGLLRARSSYAEHLKERQGNALNER
jgi:hypothetical protein